jgi:hypothetical protein
MSSLSTPVVFVVFNRPKSTQIVFNAIAQAKPAHLLIVADGPRRGIADETERCQEVREIVHKVDWPCEVHTNFASENLGCQERIISGLNWAFSCVEEAIILEDDCLPHPTFFPFCHELLARYRHDSRVAMISGDSFVERHVKSNSSYYFSQTSHIWGWATWRSAWQRYDRRLERWPEIKAANLLYEIFSDPRIIANWTRIFDRMHAGTGPNTWDYQWTYTTLTNNALSIVPRVNLVENIGFESTATHITAGNRKISIRAKAMEFPLRHPAAMIPSHSLDRRDHRLWLPPSIPARALRKLRSYAKRSGLA